MVLFQTPNYLKPINKSETNTYISIRILAAKRVNNIAS